jgi:cytochrome c-type biogenesis protein CcmH
MKRLLMALALFAAPALHASPARAEEVAEPQENRRVREVAQQLRCAVCQNESVADSKSGLAGNMRDVVREKIREGKTNDEILAYFVARYGDFILMEPRKYGVNWFLWAFPFAALLLGAVVVALRFGKGRPQAAAAEPAPAEAAADHEALIKALRSNEPAAKE